MPYKKFLEEYPLYRKFKTDLCSEDTVSFRSTFGNLPKPAIHMYCDVCNSDQTFNMINEYYENAYFYKERAPKTSNLQLATPLLENIPAAGKVVRLDYLCSDCRMGERTFLVKFFTEKTSAGTCLNMIKVGQFPPWDIEMDRELQKILAEHAEHYKKGLICESQGYGIGAFAYFRRIVEEIIDQLLDSIEGLLEGEERAKYKAALEEVKKTTVAQDKIELVRDLLPSTLRPGGVNPLSAIHSALSQGLHEESDEECLEYANAIREALIFLVNRLVRSERENKSFTESMKKLLGKTSKKIAKP